MADDAYEFLTPDLLAPPPPGGPPPANEANPQAAPAPVNELAAVSTAEKFQVKRAAKDSATASNSNPPSKGSHGKGKASKEKGNKKTKRSGRGKSSDEPLPSLSTFKWQMIISGVLVFASVGITLMVLVDGLM